MLEEVIAQQVRAADPSHSAWVMANAGSGKTKVLVDRVARLLLAGVQPSAILCVTYTNAAASEMLRRVEDLASTWASCSLDVLAQQITLLQGRIAQEAELQRAHNLAFMLYDSEPSLRVMTIHAFCQEIISRFPQEARIAPHAIIAEEAVLYEIRHTVQQRLLRMASLNATSDLADAINYVTEHRSEFHFRAIMRMMAAHRSLFSFMYKNEGAYHTAIAELYRATGISPAVAPSAVMEKYFPLSDVLLQQLRSIADILEGSVGTNDTQTRHAIRALLENPMCEGARHVFACALLTKEGTVRKSCITQKPMKLLQQNPPLYEEWEALTARAAHYWRIYHLQEIVAYNVAVLTIAYYWLHYYAEEKEQRGVVDYDDLIEKTIALLENPHLSPWVLYKLDGQIEHLLLDEAQDSSEASWQLVHHLSQEFFAGEGAGERHRTLFVVGDEKQSIYGFQGAAPAQFVAQAHTYHAKAAAIQHLLQHVPLQVSFRSTDAILAFVDAVFVDVRLRDAVTQSEDVVQHRAIRPQKAGCVRLYPLIEKEGDGV